MIPARLIVVPLCALVLAASARAQRIAHRPAADVPAAAVAAELEAGRGALAAKKPLEAARHFARALAARPDDPSILRGLLEASADDADARLLWSAAWYAATADADGRASPDPATAKLLAAGKAPAALALARAAAAKELSRFVRAAADGAAKAGKSGVAARRAALLFQHVSAPAPATVLAHGKAADEPLAVYVPDVRPTLAALEALVAEGASTASPGFALRAAQVLVALGRQAAFPDLRGPKAPDLGAAPETGRRAVDQIRAAQAKAAKAYTVEELRALDPAARGAFTRDHATWISPGVAVSPEGRYRIETVCGFETLLGTAETVELHHARLVAWYGKDPFTGRQGTVRIVPEHGSLEAEGAPFWWAGGFQGGDTTTVAFSVGNVEGLGHTLVHELTHRFDQAVYPFMPAWLAEGRGVWTAAAYASTLDERFTENHANFGTIESTFIKGYGALDNLKRLLDGTLKDYRDNYPAGYSLFVFLRSWEEGGARPYAPKLEGYMKGLLKGRGRPVDWFVANFCDGKDGRAAKLEDFATVFGTFLKGFYWQSRADWTKRYTARAGKGKASPWVYDKPTWIRDRARAEPWFGQDQARRAADVLFEAGKRREALPAYGWAFERDEWDAAAAARFAELADEAGLKDLAWCVRAEDARVRPESAPAPGPAPFLGALPKTQALLKAWRDAVDEADAAGAPLAAAVFAADHDRVAAELGLPTLGRAAPDRFEKGAHPGDDPPRPLGRRGWVEDGLTDYEEKRVPNLWFATDDGDLHVGREKPRDGTGALDRALWQRHAFARSEEWVPAGRYVVEGRVFFTTSYFSGAVVVGYRRADRVVRFQFSGGDFLYSLGVNEKAAKLDGINWHLHGRRPRDGGLGGSTAGGTHKFPGERTQFRFAILVDGPEAHAFVDDAWVGSYADLDGLPIEGFVGFAADQGAVQIGRPTVRRLDRSRASGLRLLRDDGLDLTRDGSIVDEALRNRRVRGLPVGERGTLCVFVPPPRKPPETPEEELFEFDGVLEVARALPELIKAEELPQTWVVALPKGLGAEKLKQFRATLAENGGDASIVVVEHARRGPLLRYGVEGRPPAPVPTVFLVDPTGFYRTHADFVGRPDRVPEPVRHWARALRGRS